MKNTPGTHVQKACVKDNYFVGNGYYFKALWKQLLNACNCNFTVKNNAVETYSLLQMSSRNQNI